jgi:PAS domain S-box-containing protein
MSEIVQGVEQGRSTASGPGWVQSFTSWTGTNHRLLQAIVDTTPESISIVALDGTIRYVNPAGAAALEASGAGAVEGRSMLAFIRPEHRTRWSANHARVCRGERLIWEFDLVGLRGTLRHMEAHATPLEMPDGTIAELAITRDATHRREAEDALRESERKHREILDALPAAIYTTDPAGRVTFYNKAAIELAGREPQIGSDQWCVTWRLYGSDGVRMPHDECPMAVALKENRPVRGVEALAERPDGTQIPFIPYPTPLRDRSGKLIGAVNMLVDISERKESETRQKMLLAELNHRVKNNMQLLHSLLRVAQRQTRSTEARDALADAGRRVAAMSAAQQVMYDSADLTTFGAKDLVQGVCRTTQQLLGRRIDVTTECCGGHLSNDAAMPVALILSELLINAAKHAVNGRNECQVRVLLSEDGPCFALSVHDDGPGFDLEAVGKRGSGLSLVKGLARQIGGELEVRSASGAFCLIKFPQRRQTN